MERVMKKMVLLFLLFAAPALHAFDVGHCVSVDTMPTLRFLMRMGWGVGISYEIWMANVLGLEIAAAYGQAETSEGLMTVITPRISGKYYFSFQPPFYNYVSLIVDDDVVFNEDGSAVHVFGVGPEIGSKIVVSGARGFFFEPHFNFLIKFSADVPTVTEFQVGVKAGWIF